MATEIDIQEVKESLPPEAATIGWDDDRIGAVLDNGATVTKAILKFWRFRAGQTANMVDVSESGSSRQLSKIHDQAINMLKYWEERSQAEDVPESTEETTPRVSFYPITRV